VTPFPEEGVVVFNGEDGLAVVAALDDVLGLVGQEISGRRAMTGMVLKVQGTR
jgi:hypothetical protein